ncbi:MAG TPA: hypothetical protein VGH74_03435, partial [Planctomycetaceae bacterium]
MAKCSKCAQRISDADSQIGKCSHCGAELPALLSTARPPFDLADAGVEPPGPAAAREDTTAPSRSSMNV